MMTDEPPVERPISVLRDGEWVAFEGDAADLPVGSVFRQGDGVALQVEHPRVDEQGARWFTCSHHTA